MLCQIETYLYIYILCNKCHALVFFSTPFINSLKLYNYTHKSSCLCKCLCINLSTNIDQGKLIQPMRHCQKKTIYIDSSTLSVNILIAKIDHCLVAQIQGEQIFYRCNIPSSKNTISPPTNNPHFTKKSKTTFSYSTYSRLSVSAPTKVTEWE